MSLKDILGSLSPSPILTGAFRDMSEMLEQSSKMYEIALRALLGNESLQADLEQMDDLVDQGERNVRRRLVEHVAVDPRKDFVTTLILSTIVNDAERIGDYARGLAELVPLARSDRSGPFCQRLSELAGRQKPLFDQVRAVLDNDDSSLAHQVMEECRSLKSEFTAYMIDVAQSELSADMAVVYATAARLFRRIGSHLSNICSAQVNPFDRIGKEDEES